jgi:hypothetical protein
VVAALAASQSVHAGGGRPVPPLLPRYQQECAACHMAFPPGALPATSWQHLMENLPRHYGTDASLDAASVKEISTWLGTHAGTWKRVSATAPEDRITRSEWFVRKHREVTSATWKLPAVKSPAHCAACHRGAEQGDFDEDRVRIPR